MENLTLPCRLLLQHAVEGVDLGVHSVWHHQAGHLPRARPDTSSSLLPLAPWQRGEYVSLLHIYITNKGYFLSYISILTYLPPSLLKVKLLFLFLCFSGGNYYCFAKLPTSYRLPTLFCYVS